MRRKERKSIIFERARIFLGSIFAWRSKFRINKFDLPYHETSRFKPFSANKSRNSCLWWVEKKNEENGVETNRFRGRYSSFGRIFFAISFFNRMKTASCQNNEPTHCTFLWSNVVKLISTHKRAWMKWKEQKNTIFEGARIFFGTKFPQNRNFLQFGTAFVSQNRAMKVTIAGSNYIKSISGEGRILAKRKKQEKTGCEEASIFFEATIPKSSNFDENWNGFLTPKMQISASFPHLIDR